mmetsp:Transcript_66735/g.138417  ORF Transcript_66735/g.138417 Transcript_66735/m.138417 type:complete len:98 (+) Transcript_66735:50-343(+)
MLGSTAGIPLEEEVNRDALTDNSTVYTVSMDHISMSRTTNSDFEASVGFWKVTVGEECPCSRSDWITKASRPSPPPIPNMDLSAYMQHAFSEDQGKN